MPNMPSMPSMPNMPSISAPSSVLGWRIGNKGTAQQKAGAAAASNKALLAADGSSAAPCEPLVRLKSNICRPGVPNLLRPLGTTLGPLEDAIRGQPATAPVVQALSAAADFFGAREEPERHLEFALAAHSCQAATRCFSGGVASALADLAKRQDLAAKASCALEAWRKGVQAFEDGCQEACELHAYFVFLDIKSDRALLDQVADRFCELLDLPVTTLGACLMNTRPWAEDALKELAKQGSLELLERQHAKALARWHAKWAQQRGEGLSPELKRGEQFWEGYFENLLKCSWPDFAEAFEDAYGAGPMPVDIIERLRVSMDPKSSQQVSQVSWKSLMQKHGSVPDLVAALLAEVQGNLKAAIYREKPLPRLARPAVRRCTPSSSEAPASSSSPAGNSGAAGKKGSSSPAGQPSDDVARAKPADVPTPADSAAAATPVDPRMLYRPSAGKPLAWDEYVTGLTRQDRPWWVAPGEQWQEDEEEREPLRVAALRAVNSSLAYTYRALVLRVVSGDLGKDLPLLGYPEQKEKKKSSSPHPALVVLPNGSRFKGITRFGRDSYRQMLLPDVTMTEPIASRSHFCVAFDQEANGYQLMDTGSKWGTFTKIGTTKGMQLGCGDWVRVGNAEFLVRYCGGGCSCARQHAHYRLHSLRVLREQPKLPPSAAVRETQRRMMGAPPEASYKDAAESSEDECVRDNVMQILSGLKQRGWVSQAAHLAEQAAEVGAKSLPPPPPAPQAARPPSAVREPALAPVSPLELDFISGPCAGQRFALCERLCTMGRGEGNTIQITDPMPSNVSRLHCFFEWEGNRWRVRDNGSTNGTWRRLSCVLDPSKLIGLTPGTSVLAGVHEFLVEEADMWHCYLPSAASAVLDARAAKVGAAVQP